MNNAHNLPTLHISLFLNVSLFCWAIERAWLRSFHAAGLYDRSDCEALAGRRRKVQSKTRELAVSRSIKKTLQSRLDAKLTGIDFYGLVVTGRST